MIQEQFPFKKEIVFYGVAVTNDLSLFHFFLNRQNVIIEVNQLE